METDSHNGRMLCEHKDRRQGERPGEFVFSSYLGYKRSLKQKAKTVKETLQLLFSLCLRSISIIYAFTSSTTISFLLQACPRILVWVQPHWQCQLHIRETWKPACAFPNNAKDSSDTGFEDSCIIRCVFMAASLFQRHISQSLTILWSPKWISPFPFWWRIMKCILITSNGKWRGQGTTHRVLTYHLEDASLCHFHFPGTS